jgi:hypothetical protein
VAETRPRQVTIRDGDREFYLAGIGMKLLPTKRSNGALLVIHHREDTYHFTVKVFGSRGCHIYYGPTNV